MLNRSISARESARSPEFGVRSSEFEDVTPHLNIGRNDRGLDKEASTLCSRHSLRKISQ